MVVFALFIISKAGGLIYNREFHSGMSKLSSNDFLILTGSFHGMHAITKQLCPVSLSPANPAGHAAILAPTPFSSRPTGIEVLESSHFRMQCFQTLTGTKFLLFTEPQQPNIDSMMKKIYELYADYVMKNPFYTVEMPIRCEKFDRGLDGFVKDIHVREGALEPGRHWEMVMMEDGVEYRRWVRGNTAWEHGVSPLLGSEL